MMVFILFGFAIAATSVLNAAQVSLSVISIYDNTACSGTPINNNFLAFANQCTDVSAFVPANSSTKSFIMGCNSITKFAESNCQGKSTLTSFSSCIVLGSQSYSYDCTTIGAVQLTVSAGNCTNSKAIYTTVMGSNFDVCQGTTGASFTGDITTLTFSESWEMSQVNNVTTIQFFTNGDCSNFPDSVFTIPKDQTCFETKQNGQKVAVQLSQPPTGSNAISSKISMLVLGISKLFGCQKIFSLSRIENSV